jgi:hypothetical protein
VEVIVGPASQAHNFTNIKPNMFNTLECQQVTRKEAEQRKGKRKKTEESQKPSIDLAIDYKSQ